MAVICNVCSSALGMPIFKSGDQGSITTMNRMIEGRTQVYFCGACSHLQTSELPNLAEYYALEYEINTASEEADQLYKLVDGIPVYRADHQAKVLIDKIDMPIGAKVLDYGCAKSPTLRKVVEQRPDIKPYFFDVTDRYVGFWKGLPYQVEWATHQPNPVWNGQIDVVLSFYALEHVSDLAQGIKSIKGLLKPGGTFYFLVPNVYQNTADFIVADHVNHFSRGSLTRLLEMHGFGAIEIDASAHDAAFVVKTTLLAKSVENLSVIHGVDDLRSRAQETADYWSGLAQRISKFEQENSGGRFAIYGAGFYGNYIASVLADPSRIVCFVDRNKHLQGTMIHDKPVCKPEDMPATVSHILVGLNPLVAKESIAAIEEWHSRNLSYFFL